MDAVARSQRVLIDLEAIPLATAKTAKLLSLNYPNDPTAAIATLNDLARIVAFCREHDILLCPTTTRPPK